MKKEIWIIIICIIILAGIICTVVYEQAKKAIPSNILDTNTINNIQQDDNLINQINNNISQNEVGQNEIIQNEITSNTQTTENGTSEKEPKTEEEKAIQIVKKDYKQSENVEFSVEGKDAEGNSIVVIRDPETTAALAFYFVDVSNNTFTKKEMN